MKMKMIVAVAAVLLSLVAASSARASDWPLPTADAVASGIGGHGVHVFCEESWLSWIAYFAQFGEDGGGVNGFTYPSDPTHVYVNPRQCETLHALAALGEQAGPYYASSAVLTLVHESIHTRGGQFANCTASDKSCEGRTECAALPLVHDVAVNSFHIAPTVEQPYTASVKRKIGKKRVTVTVVRYRSVANPWLTTFDNDVKAWHASKPPEYRQGC
jgi:hypothetical protein